ncbi:MAG: hypothetical protein ACTHNG_13600 [Ginsengibacter sp.]
MPEKERIVNPSMGSNEVGSETREEAPTGVSAGTDTQLEITALGGKKHKKKGNGSEDIVTDKNVADRADLRDPAKSGK